MKEVLVGHLNEGAASSYLDHMAKVLGCGREFSAAIKLPSINGNRRTVHGVRRAARAARPAVRQTFAARAAAKAADSGGSSDPDGRRPKTYLVATSSITFLPVLALVHGGAK